MSGEVRLAFTVGDPRGVGPEVCAEAARRVAAKAAVVLVGPQNVVQALELPPGAERVALDPWDGTAAGAGRASLDALEWAVSEALSGRAGGIVTGPIHKPALHEAGARVPGQTEWLGARSGAAEVGMLMCAERTRLGGALRVLLATTHLALRDVPARLTRPRVERQARLLHAALRARWGIEEPVVALCGMNPHASDGGLFGDEEERVLRPAAEALSADGLRTVGPLPADTVFLRALAGEFDAVVAPYHDVGMAAFKTAAFGAGVNVTLGLPFVRTSPDHGTAFDIAGTGRADPSSAVEAATLAVRLVKARFDTPVRGA